MARVGRIITRVRTHGSKAALLLSLLAVNPSHVPAADQTPMRVANGVVASDEDAELAIPSFALDDLAEHQQLDVMLAYEEYLAELEAIEESAEGGPGSFDGGEDFAHAMPDLLRRLGVVSSAIADGSSTGCFFGGWPSEQNGTGTTARCARPTSANNQTFRALGAAGSCTSGNFSCSPAFFGQGTCVASDPASSTFLRCIQAFDSSCKGDHVACLRDRVLAQIQRNAGTAALFAQIQARIQNACDPKARVSADHRTTCRNLAARLKEIIDILPAPDSACIEPDQALAASTQPKPSDQAPFCVRPMPVSQLQALAPASDLDTIGAAIRGLTAANRTVRVGTRGTEDCAPDAASTTPRPAAISPPRGPAGTTAATPATAPATPDNERLAAIIARLGVQPTSDEITAMNARLEELGYTDCKPPKSGKMTAKREHSCQQRLGSLAGALRLSAEETDFMKAQLSSLKVGECKAPKNGRWSKVKEQSCAARIALFANVLARNPTNLEAAKHAFQVGYQKEMKARAEAQRRYQIWLAKKRAAEARRRRAIAAANAGRARMLDCVRRNSGEMNRKYSYDEKSGRMVAMRSGDSCDRLVTKPDVQTPDGVDPDQYKASSWETNYTSQFQRDNRKDAGYTPYIPNDFDYKKNPAPARALTSKMMATFYGGMRQQDALATYDSLKTSKRDQGMRRLTTQMLKLANADENYKQGVGTTRNGPNSQVNENAAAYYGLNTQFYVPTADKSFANMSKDVQKVKQQEVAEQRNQLALKIQKAELELEGKREDGLSRFAQDFSATPTDAAIAPVRADTLRTIMNTRAPIADQTQYGGMTRNKDGTYDLQSFIVTGPEAEVNGKKTFTASQIGALENFFAARSANQRQLYANADKVASEFRGIAEQGGPESLDKVIRYAAEKYKTDKTDYSLVENYSPQRQATVTERLREATDGKVSALPSFLEGKAGNANLPLAYSNSQVKASTLPAFDNGFQSTYGYVYKDGRWVPGTAAGKLGADQDVQYRMDSHAYELLQQSDPAAAERVRQRMMGLFASGNGTITAIDEKAKHDNLVRDTGDKQGRIPTERLETTLAQAAKQFSRDSTYGRMDFSQDQFATRSRYKETKNDFFATDDGKYLLGVVQNSPAFVERVNAHSNPKSGQSTAPHQAFTFRDAASEAVEPDIRAEAIYQVLRTSLGREGDQRMEQILADVGQAKRVNPSATVATVASDRTAQNQVVQRPGRIQVGGAWDSDAFSTRGMGQFQGERDWQVENRALSGDDARRKFVEKTISKDASQDGVWRGTGWEKFKNEQNLSSTVDLQGNESPDQIASLLYYKRAREGGMSNEQALSEMTSRMAEDDRRGYYLANDREPNANGSTNSGYEAMSGSSFDSRRSEGIATFTVSNDHFARDMKSQRKSIEDSNWNPSADVADWALEKMGKLKYVGTVISLPMGAMSYTRNGDHGNFEELSEPGLVDDRRVIRELNEYNQRQYAQRPVTIILDAFKPGMSLEQFKKAYTEIAVRQQVQADDGGSVNYDAINARFKNLDDRGRTLASDATSPQIAQSNGRAMTDDQWRAMKAYIDRQSSERKGSDRTLEVGAGLTTGSYKEILKSDRFQKADSQRQRDLSGISWYRAFYDAVSTVPVVRYNQYVRDSSDVEVEEEFSTYANAAVRGAWGGLTFGGRLASDATAVYIHEGFKNEWAPTTYYDEHGNRQELLQSQYNLGYTGGKLVGALPIMIGSTAITVATGGAAGTLSVGAIGGAIIDGAITGAAMGALEGQYIQRNGKVIAVGAKGQQETWEDIGQRAVESGVIMAATAGIEKAVAFNIAIKNAGVQALAEQAEKAGKTLSTVQRVTSPVQIFKQGMNVARKQGFEQFERTYVQEVEGQALRGSARASMINMGIVTGQMKLQGASWDDAWQEGLVQGVNAGAMHIGMGPAQRFVQERGARVIERGKDYFRPGLKSLGDKPIAVTVDGHPQADHVLTQDRMGRVRIQPVEEATRRMSKSDAAAFRSELDVSSSDPKKRIAITSQELERFKATDGMVLRNRDTGKLDLAGKNVKIANAEPVVRTRGTEAAAPEAPRTWGDTFKRAVGLEPMEKLGSGLSEMHQRSETYQQKIAKNLQQTQIAKQEAERAPVGSSERAAAQAKVTSLEQQSVALEREQTATREKIKTQLDALGTDPKLAQVLGGRFKERVDAYREQVIAKNEPPKNEAPKNEKRFEILKPLAVADSENVNVSARANTPESVVTADIQAPAVAQAPLVSGTRQFLDRAVSKIQELGNSIKSLVRRPASNNAAAPSSELDFSYPPEIKSAVEKVVAERGGKLPTKTEEKFWTQSPEQVAKSAVAEQSGVSFTYAEEGGVAGTRFYKDSGGDERVARMLSLKEAEDNTVRHTLAADDFFHNVIQDPKSSGDWSLTIPQARIDRLNGELAVTTPRVKGKSGFPPMENASPDFQRNFEKSWDEALAVSFVMGEADLKPENFIVQPDGRVALFDFGQSFSRGADIPVPIGDYFFGGNLPSRSTPEIETMLNRVLAKGSGDEGISHLKALMKDPRNLGRDQLEAVLYRAEVLREALRTRAEAYPELAALAAENGVAFHTPEAEAARAELLKRIETRDPEKILAVMSDIVREMGVQGRPVKDELGQAILEIPLAQRNGESQLARVARSIRGNKVFVNGHGEELKIILSPRPGAVYQADYHRIVIGPEFLVDPVRFRMALIHELSHARMYGQARLSEGPASFYNISALGYLPGLEGTGYQYYVNGQEKRAFRVSDQVFSDQAKRANQGKAPRFEDLSAAEQNNQRGDIGTRLLVENAFVQMSGEAIRRLNELPPAGDKRPSHPKYPDLSRLPRSEVVDLFELPGNPPRLKVNAVWDERLEQYVAKVRIDQAPGSGYELSVPIGKNALTDMSVSEIGRIVEDQLLRIERSAKRGVANTRREYDALPLAPESGIHELIEKAVTKPATSGAREIRRSDAGGDPELAALSKRIDASKSDRSLAENIELLAEDGYLPTGSTLSPFAVTLEMSHKPIRAPATKTANPAIEQHLIEQLDRARQHLTENNQAPHATLQPAGKNLQKFFLTEAFGSRAKIVEVERQEPNKKGFAPVKRDTQGWPITFSPEATRGYAHRITIELPDGSRRTEIYEPVSRTQPKSVGERINPQIPLETAFVVKSKDVGKAGFSGVHTLEAWNELRQQMKIQMRHLETHEFRFSDDAPEFSRKYFVADYEYDGRPSYVPKTLLDNAGTIRRLELKIAPIAREVLLKNPRYTGMHEVAIDVVIDGKAGHLPVTIAFRDGEIPTWYVRAESPREESATPTKPKDAPAKEPAPTKELAPATESHSSQLKQQLEAAQMQAVEMVPMRLQRGTSGEGHNYAYAIRGEYAYVLDRALARSALAGGKLPEGGHWIKLDPTLRLEPVPPSDPKTLAQDLVTTWMAKYNDFHFDHEQAIRRGTQTNAELNPEGVELLARLADRKFLFEGFENFMIQRASEVENLPHRKLLRDYGFKLGPNGSSIVIPYRDLASGKPVRRFFKPLGIAQSDYNRAQALGEFLTYQLAEATFPKQSVIPRAELTYVNGQLGVLLDDAAPTPRWKQGSSNFAGGAIRKQDARGEFGAELAQIQLIQYLAGASDTKAEQYFFDHRTTLEKSFRRGEGRQSHIRAIDNANSFGLSWKSEAKETFWHGLSPIQPIVDSRFFSGNLLPRRIDPTIVEGTLRLSPMRLREIFSPLLTREQVETLVNRFHIAFEHVREGVQRDPALASKYADRFEQAVAGWKSQRFEGKLPLSISDLSLWSEYSANIRKNGASLRPREALEEGNARYEDDILSFRNGAGQTVRIRRGEPVLLTAIKGETPSEWELTGSVRQGDKAMVVLRRTKANGAPEFAPLPLKEISSDIEPILPPAGPRPGALVAIDPRPLLSDSNRARLDRTLSERFASRASTMTAELESNPRLSQAVERLMSREEFAPQLNRMLEGWARRGAPADPALDREFAEALHSIARDPIDRILAPVERAPARARSATYEDELLETFRRRDPAAEERYRKAVEECR